MKVHKEVIQMMKSKMPEKEPERLTSSGPEILDLHKSRFFLKIWEFAEKSGLWIWYRQMKLLVRTFLLSRGLAEVKGQSFVLNRMMSS